MVIEGDPEENEADDKAKKDDKKKEKSSNNQKTFHMARSRTKKTDEWTTFDKLRFMYLEKEEMENDFESEIQNEDEEQSKYWCLPFSIQDIEDFQTQMKIKGVQEYDNNQDEEKQQLEEGIEWYEPQAYNQYHLYSRVIVTMNPTDNNSTIIIIFDEPQIEEFLIKNKTD